MRVLVVEDEKKLASFIRRALREEGHAVDVAHDGEEGGHLALTESYDLILLDLLLPRRSGMDILGDLRREKKSIPVLVLTARGSVKDRVAGLDQGADDYMVKPFSLDELRARVRALLRRGQGGSSTVLRFADLSMDLIQRTVRRGEETVDLTPKEFSLLEFFLRNPDRVLTRTAIAEHVWDYNFDWQSNVVDVFVNTLRKKVEKAGSRLVQTVRGIGYVLREESHARG